MRLSVAAALLLAIAVVAPAAEPQYSRDWTRAHSPNFTAAGNAPFADLRNVLLELEGFRSALVRSLPGLRADAGGSTMIVLFRDERAFTPFKPMGATGERRDGVAAYFLATPDANYMVAAMHVDMRRTFQLFFHEYTHSIVRQNLGDVPHWLNEGLAEYYSTLRADLRARRSVLGEASPVRLSTLKSGPLLPLRDVLAFDASGKVAHTPERVAAFYAQAWALVHYLQHGEGGKLAPDVGRYLDALRRGASIDAAIATAFATTVEELESRVTTYIRRGQFATRILDEPASSAPRIAREAMREADVEALLNNLRAALR